MKLRSLLLPPAAIVAALPFIAPTEEAEGFSTLGFSLGINQRDFRVFNNFADAGANNNLTPDPNFPGYFGAVMAIWKGCIEWGSETHGDGNGDPHQPGGLGSGGANFDAHFQGEATGIGGINGNIHSEISSCGGGTLAYAESPSSNGWRIRYCGNINWKDGPGTSIGGGFDLQGVATHEYGHALGLGHTGVGGSTMTASASGNAVTDRSIGPDDIAGVQSIYGVKSATKPRITGITIASGLITITGTNFAATGNEVRFTQAAAGGNGQPILVSGVTSDGSTISVSIPATAGPGDVIVKKGGVSGGASLSNAWPTDLVDTGPPPSITALTPSTIDAVTPGGQPLTISGIGFTPITSVFIGGEELATFPATYTIVDDNTISVFEVPLLNSLGAVSVQVSGPNGAASSNLNVVVNDPPVIDLLNSDPGFIFNALGMDVVMGAQPADIFFLNLSPSLLPSVLPGLLDFGIGNNFSSLYLLGTFSADAVTGYTEVNFPIGNPLPGGTKLHFQAAVLGGVPLTPTNIETGTILL